MWRFCVPDFLPDVFLLFTTSTLALTSTSLHSVPPMVLWEPQVTEVSVGPLVSLLFYGSFYLLVWISLPVIFNYRLTVDFNWRRETWDGNNLWLRSLGDYSELLDVTLRPESGSGKRTQGWRLWGPEYCLNKCPTRYLNCCVSKKQLQVPGHTVADKQSLWHVCLLHLSTGVQGPVRIYLAGTWQW